MTVLFKLMFIVILLLRSERGCAKTIFVVLQERFREGRCGIGALVHVLSQMFTSYYHGKFCQWQILAPALSCCSTPRIHETNGQRHSCYVVVVGNVSTVEVRPKNEQSHTDTPVWIGNVSRAERVSAIVSPIHCLKRLQTHCCTLFCAQGMADDDAEVINKPGPARRRIGEQQHAQELPDDLCCG